MANLWGKKSGPHRETTQAHSSGNSHGSGSIHATAHANMLTEGQEYLQKGDKCRDQGDFDKAAKLYKRAAQSYPKEADERRKQIPLQRTMPESNESTSHPSQGLRRVRKEDIIIPSSSTGPFFPKNDQPHLSLLMSRAADMPKGSVCAFDDAKDTNDIVVSFIKADDETKNILRGQIYDIIAQFKDSLATLETVRELVTLARIPDRDIFVQIIEQLLKITKDSSLVPTIALQGLAVATNSCPDGIDMRGMKGIYSDILRPLKQRLETVRSDGNEGQLIPLLHALTALLNAMQGLAYVGNDESFGMSIYHRGRLAIAAAINISRGISNLDPEEFVKAYNNIMEMSDFTIRANWYEGLIYVDFTLDLQDWSRFERFVLESKLKSDKCFLQGVCLRLEQVAVTQPVEEIRDGAIEFLRSLSKNSSEQVRQAAMAVTERLVSSDCTRHNNTNTKHHAKTMKCTCSFYQAKHFGLPPVWDPSWHTAASSDILLKTVQQRRQNNKDMAEMHAQLGNIKEAVASNASNIMLAVEAGNSNLQASMDILEKNMTSKSTLSEIHAALESYYKSSLVIRR
ncbi:hypothetical protein BGZ80_000362, partial [Entomortierella chlamydospora]